MLGVGPGMQGPCSTAGAFFREDSLASTVKKFSVTGGMTIKMIYEE